MLVELVTPFLPTGVALHWDTHGVRNSVISISDIDVEKYWDIRSASEITLQVGLVCT